MTTSDRASFTSPLCMVGEAASGLFTDDAGGIPPRQVPGPRHRKSLKTRTEQSMSADAVADVIDAAHDELLMRGRSTSFYGPDGSMCIVNAIGAASIRLKIWDEISSSIDAIHRYLGRDVVAFNYVATDDEVFDALKGCAKAIRNGELEVTEEVA